MQTRIHEIFFTTFAVTAATAVSWILRDILPLPNLSLVFLMPVLFGGVRFGLLPSLYAAVLSFAAYNFFFTKPYFTFHVHDTGEFATLVFYLVVAAVTGNMAARLKAHMEERERMAATIEESRMLAETEKLRSALLSSISHDLRTPLSSIVGSASGLSELGDELSPKAWQELTDNILSEAERLNRFIQNLLDMTKLGHGGLRPNRDWVEFRDVLGHALHRVEKVLPARRVDIIADPGLEMLNIDPVLMEQVLVNLLDNAAKYAPDNTRVTIALTRTGDSFSLAIADQGPGVSPSDREKIFDMFYRVQCGDKVAGTGLGLSICRGLVEAHGGKIKMEAGTDGKGARIVMTFPASMASGTLIDERKVAHA
jgi:two-component system sensor histidine kinase KdpD